MATLPCSVAGGAAGLNSWLHIYPMGTMQRTVFIMAMLGFTLVTGLLAGSYPAFYLSAFQPVKVLKGKLQIGRLASLPRQMLVVLQFTVSLILIIGTTIVFRQILFTKDRPTGYNREGLFTVDMNTPEINTHYEALRSELIQQGLAADVAASNMKPTAFQNGKSLGLVR